MSAVSIADLLLALREDLIDSKPVSIWGISDLRAMMVTGVVFDSRRVRPGNIFVAVRGGSTDGHEYIPDAIARGAVGVVGEARFDELPASYFQVLDSRVALAKMSAAFYDYPSRKMTVVGVTGTDGKTTTSTLIYHILRTAGYTTGLITTVGALIGTQELDTGFHVTTPEATEIQAYLAQMAAQGTTHVVVETTSHGLDQHRVSSCEFDIGVVTNITHEHLDYHGSYQAYRQAKGRLFRLLAQTPPKPGGPPRLAVVNRDDSSCEYLKDLIDEINTGVTPDLRQTTFGIHPESECRAENIQLGPGGLYFQTLVQGKAFPIKTGLTGGFNVSNCLAAIAVTFIGLGIGIDAVQEGIASVTGIPGRMEWIDLGQDFWAIVDFAHTPHALRQALTAARQMLAQTDKPGRVISIFGSAGLRDRAKRRMMAEVAAELADISILTAEDPRTERLDEILGEMAAGAESKGAKEGRDFWRIPDRGAAFRFAVEIARPGDLVIALGKGHEQSMCFGNIEFPWDDRIAIRAAIAGLLNIPGPDMPTLPTSRQTDNH
jgi:UDP-N-acetylmuramoyl-L-alanyl-D-glutamate--2,6-diaminopimelate ligase